MVTGSASVVRRRLAGAFGHHRFEGVEQAEVSLRPHRDQRSPQPGLVAAPGSLDETLPHAVRAPAPAAARPAACW